jgi:hypothetical protein
VTFFPALTACSISLLAWFGSLKVESSTTAVACSVAPLNEIARLLPAALPPAVKT